MVPCPLLWPQHLEQGLAAKKSSVTWECAVSLRDSKGFDLMRAVRE